MGQYYNSRKEVATATILVSEQLAKITINKEKRNSGNQKSSYASITTNKKIAQKSPEIYYGKH